MCVIWSNSRLIKFIQLVLDCASRHKVLFIISWISSFISYRYLWLDSVWTEGLKWLFISFSQSFVFAAMAGWRNHRIVSIIGWILSILLITLSLISVTSWTIWGFGISSRMLALILYTNPNEANDFMSMLPENIDYLLSSTGFWISIFSFALFGILFQKLSAKIVKVIYIICLPISIITTASYAFINRDSMEALKNISLLVKTTYCVQRAAFVESLMNSDMNNYLTHRPAIPDSTTRADIIDNLIIVLGESSSRAHWQLYGYELPTTPSITSKRDSLVIFDDVIPPHNLTHLCLAKLLSAKDSYDNKEEWYNYVDIVRLAQHVGYKVYWISNQEKAGVHGECSSMLSDASDYSKHVGLQYAGDHDQEVFDDALIPEIQSALNDSASKRLIFVHMAGSHFLYRTRIPSDWSPISTTDEQRVKRPITLSAKQLQTATDYDNTIAYTDMVVGEIIDETAKTTGRSAVLFLSDHSEEMFDIDGYCGHAGRGQFIRVPMIFYGNRQWRECHSEKLEVMNNKEQTPIASENLFHAMQGLLGISGETYMPSRDFLSVTYDTTLTRFFDEAPL